MNLNKLVEIVMMAIALQKATWAENVQARLIQVVMHF